MGTAGLFEYPTVCVFFSVIILAVGLSIGFFMGRAKGKSDHVDLVGNAGRRASVLPNLEA